MFNVLEANLDKNLILKKQITKFTLKERNFRYFQNGVEYRPEGAV